MSPPVTVVGTYVSPYVRKLLVCLQLKGLDYRIDPIVPFMGNDEFSRLSPLRRVPVFMDDRVSLCDSSVICQYLEDRHPQPPLYPAEVADRARARWIEEYADSRMAEIIVWKLFYPTRVMPHVWGGQPDVDAVNHALTVELPQIFDYLEPQLPVSGWLFGSLGIADISLAAQLRMCAFIKVTIDPVRWPKTAAYAARVLALPAFEALKPFEDCMRRTPIPKHREALAALGAPLTAATCAGDTPRRGLMQL